jgi:tRNA splicing endonuclease
METRKLREMSDIDRIVHEVNRHKKQGHVDRVQVLCVDSVEAMYLKSEVRLRLSDEDMDKLKFSW